MIDKIQHFIWTTLTTSILKWFRPKQLLIFNSCILQILVSEKLLVSTGLVFPKFIHFCWCTKNNFSAIYRIITTQNCLFLVVFCTLYPQWIAVTFQLQVFFFPVLLSFHHYPSMLGPSLIRVSFNLGHSTSIAMTPP